MAVRTGAPGIDPSLAHRAGCGCYCMSGCEYSVRMRNILNVGLLFGGESPEHEVSIVTARAIAEHLDAARFTVRPMGIARNGVWVVTGDPFTRLAAGAQRAPLPAPGKGRRGDAPARPVLQCPARRGRGGWPDPGLP